MLEDDGDVVRGLGFVSMYSAWVEEDVDDLLRLLVPVEAFDEKIQRWSISKKLEHVAKIVVRLGREEVKNLPNALRKGIGLFEERNKVIHGRIDVEFDKKIYVQSGRPNIPIQPITSADLYNLANKFDKYRGFLIGPQIFRLPRIIAATISNISCTLSD